MQFPSPVESLAVPEWGANQLIRIQIKRDDLIHSIISGNKARKLHTLIKTIEQNPPARLASMGGNRSNFLHALAYLCHQYHIPLTAHIRGHKPEVFDRTLRDLERWGTELKFVSKQDYQHLREQPASNTWLPEGGSRVDALTGVIAAVNELSEAPDSIFVPVGTGCTALGIALGVQQRQWTTQVIGVVVLKGVEGDTGIQHDITQLAQAAGYDYPDNLYLEHRFCGKGFGKQSAELKQQQQDFELLWDIPLDPVYTVKMCNAFKHYAGTAHPHLGNNVLLWHTGGLQGNADN